MVLSGNSFVFGHQVHASTGDLDDSIGYPESNNIRKQEDYIANKYYARVETIELATSDDGNDNGGFLGIIDKLQELWSTLMELRSWLDDRNRENSEQLADFFNIDSQLRGSNHIGNNDGTISLLLKGQIDRLLNNIESIFTENFRVDDYNSGTIYSYEGVITKLIKGQTTRIVNAVDSPTFMSTYFRVDSDYSSGTIYSYEGGITKLIKGQTTRIVSAVNSPTYLSTYFRVDDYSSGTVYSYEGEITKLIKGQINRLSNNIESIFLEYFLVDGYSSGTVYSYEGVITKLIKGQTSRIINAVNSPTFLSTYFRVDSDYSSGLVYSYEGEITKLIKGQTSRIVNAVNSPTFLSTYFRVDSDYSSGNVYSYEGEITKLIKGQTTRIVNAIGGGVGGGDNSEVLDLLEDIKKAIEKLESTPAGSTIWDFLTSLVNGLTEILTGILDFLNNLLDFLFHALIPEDTEFIDEWFNDLTTNIDSKFSVVDDLRITLTTAFEVEEREFEDKYIEIDVLGAKQEIKFFDGTYLNMAIPYVRKFLSAIMILLTIIFAYQKITGRGGVIE